MNRYRKLFCLYKRNNGVYYYYVYKGSKRVHFSTGQKVKAKAFEVAMKNYNKQDEMLVIKKQTATFSTFASGFFAPHSEYVEYRNAHGFALTHGYLIRMNGIVENRLIPQFGTISLDKISAKDIEKWLLSLNCSSKTKNSYLSALNIIFEWAYKKGILFENVVKKVSRVKNTKLYERGTFTADEIKALLSYNWQNENYRLMCELSAFTGMRLGEVLGLHIEDIKATYINVVHSWNNRKDGVKSPKSRKGRIVPLSHKISILLQNCYKNRTSGLVFASRVEELPHIQSGFKKEFSSVLKAVIPNYTKRHLCFHSFRHYFNTALVSSGLSGEIVRAVIGHESTSMTDNYLHLDNSDLNGILKVQNEILDKISGE